MIDGSIEIVGTDLIITIKSGADTLKLVAPLADLRRGILFPLVLPDLPKLPPSLLKRMGPDEVRLYDKAVNEYKVKLTLAIKGQKQ